MSRRMLECGMRARVFWSRDLLGRRRSLLGHSAHCSRDLQMSWDIPHTNLNIVIIETLFCTQSSSGQVCFPLVSRAGRSIDNEIPRVMLNSMTEAIRLTHKIYTLEEQYFLDHSFAFVIQVFCRKPHVVQTCKVAW